ncbi:MAG TPA: Asp-tRNA(Asn)/Glu-tRNA(Gln) amidotransferase GatCAB subunit C [Cytophagales bacterium]|jgi:aspartyl-tRNA(Asn)/glutamyl-tRNA(Gln) amidotransferase subunit C|nr:Asp-tRNA(Asn)/Glu-tRNA(Gln) amidotransferase GatCAB subunit C [Cytophagales bacterium]
MKIDKDTLHKLAHLARLELREEDGPGMMKDLEEILTWVEQLNEIDTEGVEPITNMSFETNVFRSDEVKNQLPHDSALKNAPKKDEGFFRVPKFLD